MELFQVVALLVALTAFFAYLNHWTLQLPTTIGVMGLALVSSLVLIALGRRGVVGEAWTAWFRAVDFGPTLLQGMLGFLLFAGALHVDLGDLLDRKGVVALLANPKTRAAGAGYWNCCAGSTIPGSSQRTTWNWSYSSARGPSYWTAAGLSPKAHRPKCSPMKKK